MRDRELERHIDRNNNTRERIREVTFERDKV